MCLDEMLEFGRDTISTSICSTPNHKMTRVQCKNNGVSLKAESQHFATVNDDNHRLASMPYFGVIEEIWELNFHCVFFSVSELIVISMCGLVISDLLW